MIKTLLENVEIRDNGLVKLDLANIPVPKAFIHQFIISIPPMVIGGNHKHLHEEIFFSTNENLEVHWMNEKGDIEKSRFREGINFYLFHVLAGVPHAVVNYGNSPAILVEFANSERKGTERVGII